MSCASAISCFAAAHNADRTIAPALLAWVDQGKVNRRNDLAELYDSLRPSLFAYLTCIGLKTDEAEEIIQESFLRLAHHILKRGNEENLRGWVFRVAHNSAIDLSRSLRDSSARTVSADDPSVQEPLDSALNPEELAIKREQLRHLRAAMARLTAQQQYAVLLRAEGLRYREIAGVLGVSFQRVADLVQRAMVRLAGDL